ncbi:hypothetical protein [Flavobacterium sp. M31R6]|uniref:hypothetical protein n=1 Tax=Flavobacterium sp. M31R6 TaxID=2739062 RepID=UPI0015692FD4|nr:hypothetical protein [Flavobacterium sp. M31R6]QKJ61855.1 hypothetical protein HQN62_01515 [Flavobacterium sp. M31R6]
MKKIILLLFIFGFNTIHSQDKVTYKKGKFFVPTILYSQYPCLDNVITQTTFYQMDPELKSEEQVLKKSYFNIDGYIKDPSNGKLKIYITIPFPRYTTTQMDSVYNSKTKVWIYHPYSGYDVKVNIEVKCADKLIYSDVFVSSEKNVFQGGYNKESAREAVAYNREKMKNSDIKENLTIEELGIDTVIYSTMDRIQRLLNYKLGYYNDLVKDKFEFMTSKAHPEYLQMFAFENAITEQMGKVTLEKGLDAKTLIPHLLYLESLLTKYPQAPENENIRFITAYDLALTYLLLENKEKALYFADLVIKNDKQSSKGTDIIARVNKAYFVDKMTRTHTNRFVELKKLGFKIKEEKEEERLAFFERIIQEDADWEQEKINRTNAIEKSINERKNILDSVFFQKNSDLLGKILNSLGGSEAIKKIEKTHILSKLKLEDNNMPQMEEKWATEKNYLLKKKTPNNYFEIVNGPESWVHDDMDNSTEKWKKINNSDYSDIVTNLDPLNLLTSFRIDLWNKFDLVSDDISDGRLCYHLTYFEKTLNSSNRTVPKTEYNLYVDKENFTIVSFEKTEYFKGNKSSFERKIFQDYREILALNNGKIPHKVLNEIEDYYGETSYQELREKVEVNPVFGNRIFMKEVYFGSFK